MSQEVDDTILMSREITKRFAAIGDELSPPKPKAALAGRNDKKLASQKLSWEELEVARAAGLSVGSLTPAERQMVREEFARYQNITKAGGGVRARLEYTNDQNQYLIRLRVVRELGPGIPSDVLDGIVQAEMEYDNATRTMDDKKAKWWRERLDYIKYQARKQSRGMLEPWSPQSPILNDFMKVNYYAQQEIERVTGIKQVQEMDLATDDLVVRRQYPDGKVSMERISRYDIQDKVPCRKCGQPQFYPDGKTYHLCPAVIDNTKLYNGNYSR